MESGLQIKFLWHDTDVIEVSITASNGEFGGSARAYINHDDLKDAASVLAGFPNSPSDTRVLSIGSVDPMSAGGGASLSFFCKDLRGQAVIEVRIAAERGRDMNAWNHPAQSAHFFADVEAAAIDDFVRALNAFDPYESAIAFLRLGTR
jgi:hypothetical protein